ncbi:MAG: hypothetical protein KIS77_19880 [Saprospiraceae bacterium]|nr:hypothetical protein [Saprospiraceae bacterium]
MTAQPVELGSSFTVNFDAPINCVNGATVRESMVDVATDPPGGDGCVADVYIFEDDFPLCTPMLAGWVRNANGADIDDAAIRVQRTMTDPNCPPISICPTTPRGPLCPCDMATYKVTPQVRFTGFEHWVNGVTSFDLALISRHIHNIIPFTSIYQYAAADATNNGQVQSDDIDEIRKLRFWAST